jgi:hypothetical protein
MGIEIVWFGYQKGSIYAINKGSRKVTQLV